MEPLWDPEGFETMLDELSRDAAEQCEPDELEVNEAVCKRDSDVLR